MKILSNTYRVLVYRTRTPQEMLDATACRQQTNPKVMEVMPRGEGSEAEVTFFKVGRYVTDDELEKEYELRGLIPADPYSQSAVNEADPAFATIHPNVTHWKDVDGQWCCVYFCDWAGNHKEVSVYRRDSWWHDGWWFAGLRKISTQTSGS